jgi:outer membrane immunogenic protein
MQELAPMLANQRRTAAKYAIAASAVLVAATLGASPAFAQDDAFNGFRIEAITGYDNEGVDFDDDFLDGGKQSQSGWMYGLNAGYDYQAGPWVFGAEVEWSDSTASRDNTYSGLRPAQPIVPPPPPIAVNLTTEQKAGADIYLGLRGGYAVTPAFLLYGKIGWSFTKIEIDGSGTDGGVAFSFDESVSLDGFRLGIGGQYMVGRNWYLMSEYRYTNYNNGDFDVRGNNANLAPLFEGIDVVRHQFVVGVGLRF